MAKRTLRHQHVITGIDLRGKVDSVYVRCFCGKEELVALWWTAPPRGWNKEQWNRGARWAAQILAESVYVVAAYTPPKIKEAHLHLSDDLYLIQKFNLKLQPVIEMKNSKEVTTWACGQVYKTPNGLNAVNLDRRVSGFESPLLALEAWKKKFFKEVNK